MVSESLPRVGLIKARLALAGTRGLEIGPLFAPIVRRDEAEVRYLDIHLTPALQESYAHQSPLPFDDFVHVDYALIAADGAVRSPSEAIGDYAPVDWVVASHVIEHVPDVIGWLRGLAEVLVDGGLLSLAIPDRRYCFDALRPPTTVGELLAAHLSGDASPRVRAVYDHFSQAISIDAAAAWQGQLPGHEARIHDIDYAWSQVQRALDGEHVDCHVWLFTPESFTDQLGELAQLGYLDFSVDHLVPTAVNELEFYVTLRRLPRGMSQQDKAAAVQASMPAPPAPPAGTPPERPDGFVTSTREQAAIKVKRAVFTTGWRVLGRLRRLRRGVR